MQIEVLVYLFPMEWTWNIFIFCELVSSTGCKTRHFIDDVIVGHHFGIVWRLARFYDPTGYTTWLISGRRSPFLGGQWVEFWRSNLLILKVGIDWSWQVSRKKEWENNWLKQMGYHSVTTRCLADSFSSEPKSLVDHQGIAQMIWIPYCIGRREG